VTILQQIKNSPLRKTNESTGFRLPHAPQIAEKLEAWRSRKRRDALFPEFGDPVRETRDFALRSVAVDDALLRGANDGGLCLRHCRERAAAVAGGDRFFDFAHRRAQARAARFIDDSAALDLASGLFRGFRVGHDNASLMNERRL
jgi:hypothetical protein